MSVDSQCPICRQGAEVHVLASYDASEVRCVRCGRYRITRSLATNMMRGAENLEDEKLRPYLPAYTRQASERGELPSLHTENWRDLARAHIATPIVQKLRKTLELFARQSTELGARVDASLDTNYPAVDARSRVEFETLLRHLIETEHIESRERGVVRLTIKGWQAVEPTSGPGIPGRCFVAMSFDPRVEDAWQQGIRPGVMDAKCEPVRIDKVHHNEKICDKILAEIRKAHLAVADVTLQRQGVYFEAGFAMGLGRPVIWTCQEDDFANSHFDTRQYNHIVWKTPADLREKLRDRIEATILS